MLLILAALHHESIDSHPELISNLIRFEGSYDWRGLTFPIALDKINIFEWKNDVSVNVLAIAGKKPYILRKAKFDGQRRVNLLLIADDEKRHYAAIKNLSRLLGSSNNSDEHQQHFRLNYLQGFQSKGSRNKHYEYCVDNEAVKIDMPEEISFVRFYSGQYQFKVPFAIILTSKQFWKRLKVWRKRPTRAPPRNESTVTFPPGFCTYIVHVLTERLRIL